MRWPKWKGSATPYPPSWCVVALIGETSTVKIHPLLRGLAPAFLLLSLTACGTKPAVRTQLVEVQVPVYVPVPDELTEPEPEPVLPADPTNADLADYADALRAWGRAAYGKLRRIRGLQPQGGEL